MKIVEALRKVYEAMGGSDSFSETDIATGIEQISEVASGGGSGGSAFGITPIPVTREDDTYTIEMTWQELYDANQTQIIFLGFSDGPLAWIPVDGVYNEGTPTVAMAYLTIGNNDVAYLSYQTFTATTENDKPQWVD